MSQRTDDAAQILTEMKDLSAAIKEKIDQIKAGKQGFDRRIKACEEAAYEHYRALASEAEIIFDQEAKLNAKEAALIASANNMRAPGAATPLSKNERIALSQLHEQRMAIHEELRGLGQQGIRIGGAMSQLASQGLPPSPNLIAFYSGPRASPGVLTLLNRMNTAALAARNIIPYLQMWVSNDYAFQTDKLTDASAGPPLKQILALKKDIDALQKVPSPRALVQHAGIADPNAVQYLALVHKAEDIGKVAEAEFEKIAEARLRIEDELERLEHFLQIRR